MTDRLKKFPWFKFQTRDVHKYEIRSLPPELQIWVYYFRAAYREGIYYPGCDPRVVAFWLQISVEEYQDIKQKLTAAHMLDKAGIPAWWEEDQRVKDPKSAERVARHRNKQAKEGDK